MDPHIKRVLCPVDFSDFSIRALAYAVAVARWYEARLSLLYVHSVPLPAAALFAGLATVPMETFALSSADREQLRAQMTGMLPATAATVPVDCVVAEGDVAAEIVAEAERADIVVMGTHGRSGFEHLMLGSVTEKVLRRAVCPLMTVPLGSADASVAVPSLFRHILAAVDLSSVSLHALRYAISLAEETDAQLTILHVADTPRELAQWAEDDAEGRSYVERWKARALAHVKTLVPAEARTYCFVDERVEGGVPYREILRVAGEQPSDLLVMGTHGGGGLARRFVGSTAQHVVRESVCPVLTVPPPHGGSPTRQQEAHIAVTASPESS